MDVQMPEMDGYVAVRRIRRRVILLPEMCLEIISAFTTFQQHRQHRANGKEQQSDLLNRRVLIFTLHILQDLIDLILPGVKALGGDSLQHLQLIGQRDDLALGDGHKRSLSLARTPNSENSPAHSRAK